MVFVVESFGGLDNGYFLVSCFFFFGGRWYFFLFVFRKDIIVYNFLLFLGARLVLSFMY